MKEWEKFEGEFREAVLRTTKPRKKGLSYDPNHPAGSFYKIFQKFQEKLGPASSKGERKERTRYFACLFVTVLKEARIPVDEDAGFIQAYSGEYTPLVDRRPVRIIQRKRSAWRGAGLHLIKSHPDP